jgi:hypothetical protein
LLVRSFTNGNARKIEGVSAGETSKLKYTVAECKSEDTEIQGKCKFKEHKIEVLL